VRSVLLKHTQKEKAYWESKPQKKRLEKKEKKRERGRGTGGQAADKRSDLKMLVT
jgi:hypothetical protein